MGKDSVHGFSHACRGQEGPDKDVRRRCFFDDLSLTPALESYPSLMAIYALEDILGKGERFEWISNTLSPLRGVHLHLFQQQKLWQTYAERHTSLLSAKTGQG